VRLRLERRCCKLGMYSILYFLGLVWFGFERRLGEGGLMGIYI
jgi:hypothetical protein